MASQGDMTIDALSIKISTQAGKSSGGIEKLVASLTNLKSIIQVNTTKINNLNTALKELESTSKRLKNINIKTNIKTNNVNTTTNTTKNKTSDVSTSVSKSVATGGGADTKGMEQTANALVKIGEASQDASKGIDRISELVSDATSKMNNANGVIDKFSMNLKDTGDIKFNTVYDQISYLTDALKQAKDMSGALNTSISNTSTIGGQKLTSTVSQSGKNAPIVSVKSVSGDSSVGDSIKQAGAAAQGASSQVSPLSTAFEKISDIANRLKGVLPKTFSSVGTLASTAVKGVSKLGSALASLRNGAIKMSQGVANAFNKMGKKLGLFSIQLVGVRGAFTALRKAVSSYMAYDQTLNDQLQNDWAVLGSLLAPALEKIVEIFTRAVAYINAFISALLGIDLVARANARSADKAAKSTKGYANELGNLAKFDDLNVIDFGKDDKQKPLTTAGVDTSWMDAFVDKIKINDWYGLGMEIGRSFNEGLASIDFDWFLKEATQWGKNMGDLFNGLTDGVDWNRLGSSIAMGLNTAMAFVNTFFDRYNFDRLGQSLARGINSLIDTVDWAGVGQLFGNKLQAFGEIIYNFANGTDFAAAGESFGTAINSLFDYVDIGQLTSGIITTLKGVFDTITTTINSVDFGTIGDKITAIFENLDLGGVATKLSKTVVSALNGLSTAIGKVNWGALGEQIANFLLTIDWIGILTGLLGFIGNALLGLGEFLWTFLSTLLGSLWESFIGWFESTPFGETFISFFDALFGAIQAIWDNVVPYFEGIFDAIISVFSPIVDQLGNIFSTAWDGIKIVWDVVTDYFKTIFNSIKTIFSFVKSVLSGDFKGAWDAIKSIVNTWVGFFSGIWNNIKKVFSVVGDFFKNTFKNAWELVKAPFSAVGSFFGGIFETIKNIFKNIGTTVADGIGDSFRTVINTITEFATKLLNKFIRGINAAISVINAIPGVNIHKLTEIEIPKLKTGTNRIESEGLYHLHKDEAVVPKKYNPAVNNQLYSDTNRDILIALNTINNSIQEQEQTTIVNVDGKEKANDTYKKQRRQTNIYGKTITA